MIRTMTMTGLGQFGIESPTQPKRQMSRALRELREDNAATLRKAVAARGEKPG